MELKSCKCNSPVLNDYKTYCYRCDAPYSPNGKRVLSALKEFSNILTDEEKEKICLNDLKDPYRDLWMLLDDINKIMWESYMIKDKEFGRDEGKKIMQILEQWAERH